MCGGGWSEDGEVVAVEGGGPGLFVGVVGVAVGCVGPEPEVVGGVLPEGGVGFFFGEGGVGGGGALEVSGVEVGEESGFWGVGGGVDEVVGGGGEGV